MSILKSNAKPASFQKHIPTYPNYQSLSTLINDTIHGVDKVVTHILLELFRTEHAFTSTVSQNLRILLHSRHRDTHKFVQEVHNDLKNSVALVEQLDNYILYTIVIAGVILCTCTITAFCMNRSCVRRDIKAHHKKVSTRPVFWQ